jgi:hypothetical protein
MTDIGKIKLLVNAYVAILLIGLRMEYGLEWRFETSSKKFSVRVLQHELMQL